MCGGVWYLSFSLVLSLLHSLVLSLSHSLVLANSSSHTHSLFFVGCVLPFNNIASSLLLERDYFKLQDDGCTLIYQGCQNDTNIPNNLCSSDENYQLPLPYYYESSGGVHQLQESDVDCTEDYWKDECTVEYCQRKDDSLLKV